MTETVFAAIRSAMPDAAKPFIRTPSGRTITYGALLETSGRLANTLVDLNVTPGDRVAVQVEKSADALLLYLGCLRAGAAYLPLNIGYTGAELSYFLSDAKPKVLICAPERRDEAAAIAEEAGVPVLETLGADGSGSILEKARKAEAEFSEVARGTDDLAAILYTSGTTGRAKGAMLSHGNLTSNAGALVRSWHFGGDDVLLHALPIFHTHGLFVATNVTLLAGASMILLPDFDLEEVLRQLPQSTAMMGVPTFYTRLLSSAAFDRDLVRHIRLFVSGSAPLSIETHKAFEARTGHAILERYGMTETNMITSNPYEGERRAGTVGHPLPGIEVRIADRESGAPLPQGEVGQIEVRGPNLFKGYWGMPEKTKAEFRGDGFFVTGDLGRLDGAGYLSIVGRDKDLIITGGYNVYPAEVEVAIEAIEGVAETAVIGLPHPDFGEGVTALVVTRANTALSEADLRRALTARLAKYKVPKRVLFLDGLPRNKMSKIEKASLRKQFAALYLRA